MSGALKGAVDARATDRGLLEAAGLRYWTASLLPAVVGSTLPLWLRPPGFSFRWLPAGELLAATVLVHAGFCLLLTHFRRAASARSSQPRLLGAAAACLVVACLLGLHLDSGLQLHAGVPGIIFPVLAFGALFTGLLYVVPPLSFWRRMGGEIVLAEGLGLLPVLGAYLVQVGDLTRSVYVASGPLVVATGLWVWAGQLADHADDRRIGRETLVSLFGPAHSARFVAPALVLGVFATLITAVVFGALPIFALAALVMGVSAARLIAISRHEYERPDRMLEATRIARRLHQVTSVAVAAAPLLTMLGS